MAYTTINKSSDYFNNKLWTGNGNSSHAQTGVGFQPDLVWLKARSESEYHFLFDAIRGATKGISSDLTAAEATYAEGLKSFDSDGFTIGTSNGMNRSGTTYASWNWKGNGAGSSNTDGSITSTVSANTTAGFSIVKFTGTGANATVGHGLGSVPKFIFGKNASVGTSAWPVYSSVLGGTKYLNINTNSGEGTFSGYWNNTNPTSSLISIGSHGDVNGVGDNMIYYCFAEKTGYSKFGSYVGNSDTNGTFVYTGFKPAFVMIKNTTNANNWFIIDNKRALFNLADDSLFPNSNSAEMTTQPTNYGLDILSNGMKMRTSGDHTVNNNNASSNTYIYMAFAEAPLVGSNNVPCTAR